MTLATDESGLGLDQTEELILVHDRSSGLGAVVAIDDTTLGPAIGGVRWRAYPDEASAVTEVRRLARVMTLKSAIAGIPSGGAKGVIFKPLPSVSGSTRREVIEAFGRLVRRLDGTYVPGLDMGTSLDDLRVMSTQVPGICIMEPSEQTAAGVFVGIVAAVESRWDTDLSGHTVLIQGAGHVGANLATRLSAAGARVTVADVDAERARAVCAQVGGTMIDPGEVIGHPCDVFVPCAVGRLVDADSVGILRCAVIAGAANDVLSTRAGADLLRAREIDYVPDFLINSGGVIAIHAKRAGWDEDRMTATVGSIGKRVRDVLRTARDTGRTPLEVAEEMASAQLGHRVTVPD